MFPGLVKPQHAIVSVNALHDSVMWTYLSTGPEATLHESERQQAYALVAEREALKEQLFGPPVSRVGDSTATAPASIDAHLARLSEVRSQLKSLMAAWTVTGYVCVRFLAFIPVSIIVCMRCSYKYTGSVYREICTLFVFVAFTVAGFECLAFFLCCSHGELGLRRVCCRLIGFRCCHIYLVLCFKIPYSMENVGNTTILRFV